LSQSHLLRLSPIRSCLKRAWERRTAAFFFLLTLTNRPAEETQDPSSATERKEQVRTLAARWAALRAEEPLRTRAAADRLGVSEADLVSLDSGTEACRRLAVPGSLAALMAADAARPGFMLLVRNSLAVHEVKLGPAEQPAAPEPNRLAGRDFTVDADPAVWAEAYAVEIPGQGRAPMPSVQLFDRSGQAVAKVYGLGPDGGDWWRALIDRFASDDQEAGRPTGPGEPASVARPDSPALDEAFWESLFADLVDQSTNVSIELIHSGWQQTWTGAPRKAFGRGPFQNLVHARFNLHLEFGGVSGWLWDSGDARLTLTGPGDDRLVLSPAAATDTDSWRAGVEAHLPEQPSA
jgi:putative heme degradation protein